MLESARTPRLQPETPLDYALALRGLTWGNRTRLLVGGMEAFPPMLEAIAGAREEVLLESYIIDDDTTGREFLGAVADAARRGCRVYVVVDGVGSLMLPEARLEEVRRAGGHALEFHPVAPWRRRWGLWRRDHRKMLVVDGRIGFLGGLNLADNYDERRSATRWHDLHLSVEGPAASSLRRIFTLTWNNECDRRERIEPPMGPLPDPADLGPAAGAEAVQIVGNIGFGNRGFLRHAFLYAVKRAHRSVYIENAYFIPDRPISRALRRAARRGVDVRVVIPARSDARVVDLACRAALPPLLADGVRVAEWAPGMMHAKAAVVDGRWATVGSYNLDHRSLRYSLEVTANVYDASLASQLEARVLSDFNASSEISLASFSHRPWLRRLAQAVAYRLRALL